jgi:hypothetical protein
MDTINIVVWFLVICSIVSFQHPFYTKEYPF